jgi:MFS family permease
MVLWGGVTVCTAAVSTYQGLYVQRFFLGVTEASIAPAFSLITVMWYKKTEVPLRYAIWYSGAGMGALVGSLIIYAIGHISGKLSPWKYQFIVIGAATAVWGVVQWFLLPDNPVSAFFLSERQRVVAIERLRADQVGIENKTIKKEQVVETFKDPKTYMYIIMVFACNLTNGAATGFGSIIVQSFGVSVTTTTDIL